MVKYRLFVQKIANQLGIIGDVQNQPDGTVLIHAWAHSQEILNQFLTLLQKGSVLSRVDNIQQVWENKTYEYPEQLFRIIR